MPAIQNNIVSDVIFLRRSVRSYQPERLEQETIESLLHAAIRAPTAMHQEPWRFIVIQDQSLLNHISTIAKPLFQRSLHSSGHAEPHTDYDFSDPKFNIFYGADTLIVIVAQESGHFVEADCWLAAENLMLAATEMGLGTCVIGSAIAALNTPDMRKQLKIPQGYVAIAPIIVGVPRGRTEATPRKDPIVLSWIK